MALLLAMYQKLRLTREKNQLVLEQTKASSKLSRVEKKIEKVQKRYTSILANIDKQANMANSQFKNWMQQNTGLGGQNLSIMNFGGAGGMTNFMMSALMGWASGGGAQSPNAQAILQAYMSGGLRQNLVDGENGTKVQDKDNPWIDASGNSYTAADYQELQSAIQQASYQQSMAQQWVSQQTQYFESNSSIWVEAEKARIEEEQDAMLEPLNYEQTMLELEKDQKDMRLKRLEAELQSYEQLASNEAQNSAPKFGLG